MPKAYRAFQGMIERTGLGFRAQPLQDFFLTPITLETTLSPSGSLRIAHHEQ